MVDLVEIQTAYYMITATGVLIAAIYYVVNTRTTLRTRQAQLFMPIYANFYNEDFMKAAHEMLFTTSPHSRRHSHKTSSYSISSELRQAFQAA